jgi:hypothetical protein
MTDRWLLITYPFPLTTGETCYLNLPADLSQRDADRLCAMIQTLPLPLEPETEWPENGC